MRLCVARPRLLGMQVRCQCRIGRLSMPPNPWHMALGDEVALNDDVVLLTTGARVDQPRLVISGNTYVTRFYDVWRAIDN